MPYYDRACTACDWTKDDCWEAVADRVGQCPDCGGETQRIWKPGLKTSVRSDEWAGGKTFENGFATPQTFYSPSEYHKALSARGLKVRGDGEEGRWSPMSKEGLQKAEALVRRVCS